MQRRQNTVSQYIAKRFLLDICEATERNKGGTGGYVVVVSGGNLFDRG